MANTKTKNKPVQGAEKTTVAKADSTTVDKAEEVATAPVVAKEVDQNQFISVKNGFQGVLVYKSSRTGERFTWSSFGDEQEMELRELRNAKSSSKKMFENNWFMFDKNDDWVIDYLGVRAYYKNSLNIDNFDSIFKMTPAEIKKTVGAMADGLKKSVSYRARVLIGNGEIDSRKTISALEEALGTELIEK